MNDWDDDVQEIAEEDELDAHERNELARDRDAGEGEDGEDDWDCAGCEQEDDCEGNRAPHSRACIARRVGANEDGSCPTCGAETAGAGPASCGMCVEAVRLAGDAYDLDFAEPGGNSALRAAGPGNPRNLACPECGRRNVLTPADVARGYRCDVCADAAEGGYGP